MVCDNWKSSKFYRLVVCFSAQALIVLPPVYSSIAVPDFIENGLSNGQSHPPRWEASNAVQEATVITVDFEMTSGDEGILVTGGDDSERYSLAVKSGRLIWLYACIFQSDVSITLSDVLPTGLISVRYEFGPLQSLSRGRHRQGKLFVNGRLFDKSSNLPQPDSFFDSIGHGPSFTGRIQRLSFAPVLPEGGD